MRDGSESEPVASKTGWIVADIFKHRGAVATPQPFRCVVFDVLNSGGCAGKRSWPHKAMSDEEDESIAASE